jgi:hypothetical protein
MIASSRQFIRGIVHDDDTFFRVAAMAVASVSAYFTFWFVKGTSDDPTMGTALGLALALAALAGPRIWPYVMDAISRKDTPRIVVAGLAAFLCLASDAWTNIGSVLWQRTNSLQSAKVDTIKFDDARDQVSEGKASLGMWTERLKKLEAENGWIATVTASSMRAQLASANLAIDQESKRGGCGPKCLAFTKARDDLSSKIALAEEKADLTKKIEATKIVLANHREKAATEKPRISSAGIQNTSLAVIWNGDLNPNAETQDWMNYITGLFLGLFLTVGGPLIAMVGVRKVNEHIAETNGRPGASEPAPTQMTKMRSSFRDSYNRHCRTYGVAPVAA